MLLSILGLINICLCAVVELTPDSFDTLVKSQYSLVEFFAPWCGHCKLLAPIYAQVAEAYASTDKILIASVDVDKYPELGKKFGIKGFPTIKWFGKDKEPVTYDKGRTLDDFIDFIAEQTGVESKSSKVEKVSKVVIADPDSMPEITKGLALVEFFAPWCGHCKKLAPIYEQLADIFANDEHCVVASLDGDRFTAMAETFDIKGYPTLMFFEKGVQTSYEGGRTLKDMVAFLNGKCNTHRTLDGTLDGKSGRVPECDVLVASYTNQELGIEELASQLAKKADCAYYARVAKKIANKKNFATTELARLSKLVKASVAPAKRDQIQTRMNVLKKFLSKDVNEEL